MKADLYNPRKPTSFRCAYHHRIGPPAGETPPEKVEAAVINIVEAWNAGVPARKVRILNDVRFDMVRAALYQFTEEEILQAIAFYGSQSWQKKNNQWKQFDDFFYSPPPRNAPLLTWWEQAVSAAEKAEEKRPPAKPVRDLAARIGHKIQLAAPNWNNYKQAFFSMSAEAQALALKLAEDDLRKARPTAKLSPEVIFRHALVLMQAKK